MNRHALVTAAAIGLIAVLSFFAVLQRNRTVIFEQQLATSRQDLAGATARIDELEKASRVKDLRLAHLETMTTEIAKTIGRSIDLQARDQKRAFAEERRGSP